MKTRSIILPFMLALFAFSCDSTEDAEETATAEDTPAKVEHPALPTENKVEVKEVIHTTSYTYLRVDEAGIEKWLAISRRDTNVGETLFYTGAIEMRDFHSKELDRTFESVHFVDSISDKPQATMGSKMPPPHGKPVSEHDEDISVAKAEGGVSIEELFAKKNNYANQKVKVRGEVTKYNAGIMGKNWVHIQDGTGGPESYDLTLTTQDEVKIGDVATFEGTVILNRDFGAGYSYDVIVENAKLVK